MAAITLHGTACNTNGDLPAVGSTAPDFKLTTGELGDVTLADYASKKKLLNIVPSLDTGVCALSTKRFNTEMASREGVVALVISADLPFASSRFLQAESIANVINLGMMRSRNFAKDYGMLITDGPLAGVTGRAVVVLDEDNKVLYTELVTEIGEEPDYDAALAALG